MSIVSIIHDNDHRSVTICTLPSRPLKKYPFRTPTPRCTCTAQSSSTAHRQDHCPEQQLGTNSSVFHPQVMQQVCDTLLLTKKSILICCSSLHQRQYPGSSDAVIYPVPLGCHEAMVHCKKVGYEETFLLRAVRHCTAAQGGGGHHPWSCGGVALRDQWARWGGGGLGHLIGLFQP